MMLESIHFFIVAIVSFGVSAVFTGILVRQLIKNKVLDIPNERSSHCTPIPRGGGISIITAIIIGWLIDRVFANTLHANDLMIMGALVALAGVCFVDDLRGVPVFIKLIFQVLSVAPGLWILAETGGVFQEWLILELDLALTGVLWIWFINLFNFMDGIDGITGSQVVVLALGLATFSATGMVSGDVLGLLLALLAAALGFLVWNWSPAKVFIGDVGSIPLGYLIGWLLLSITPEKLSFDNVIVIIIILPSYYLADASITLAIRVLGGKNPFQAHRDHFYQKATRNGYSHARICCAVILTNLFLLIIAWTLAVSNPYLALIATGIIIAMVFCWMLKIPKKVNRLFGN
jgi:Fuc2NAc and GlcNAc transferase